MIQQREVGRRAQITFTSDFHELVTGDLCPECPVILSYDPRRIVPPTEGYEFGDPRRPITAFIQFRDDMPWLSVVVSSPGRVVVVDEDPTGQGSMLKACVHVPANADRVSIWFLYTSISGAAFYDSDFGQNFNFRFPSRDIAVLSADVHSDAQKQVGSFSLSIAAALWVDDVTVRFHRVGSMSSLGDELRLTRTEQRDSENRPIWSIAGVVVAYQAVIRFKVFYWISGRRYKDDNTGHYYLAPQPAPVTIPPPPNDLAVAAQAWK